MASLKPALIILLPFIMVTTAFGSKRHHRHSKDSGSDTCKVANLDLFLMTEFKYSELQTIKIIIYKKNTDFKEVIDSFFANPYWDNRQNSPFIVNLPYGKVLSTMDWKVIVNDTMLYKVTDVHYGSVHTENGIHITCYLYSYKVNGKTDDAHNVYIDGRYYLPNQ